MWSAPVEGVDDDAGWAAVGGTKDAPCGRIQDGVLVDKAKGILEPGRHESTDEGNDNATAGHGDAERYGADNSDCDNGKLVGRATTDGRVNDGLAN